MVTALILLVNPSIRKHRIPVSGLTGRKVRRADTPFRDDQLRGYEGPVLRDQTRGFLVVSEGVFGSFFGIGAATIERVRFQRG